MVQNWTDEWCRAVLMNSAEQYWRMVQLYWWMVQNCAGEWCKTVLTNGAEQYQWIVQLYWWMVQNCANEWCRTVQKDSSAVLMNGAPLCFYWWSPVVLELTNGNWEAATVVGRSLRSVPYGKTQHTISDNDILELALHTMKWWGKLELWITITKLFYYHLNYSPTLELVQKSNGDQ